MKQLINNTAKLKAENDKLKSQDIELKESMLFTEYIAKKKNLILSGVKDYPETGDEVERILKIYSNLCSERIGILPI